MAVASCDQHRFSRADSTSSRMCQSANRVNIESLTLSTTTQLKNGAATLSADARIEELGIDLTQPSNPIANYVPAVRVGNLLFLSGNGPRRGSSSEMVTGKVGADLTVEEGYEAARLVGIQLLASIKRELGTLDSVERCVKALGMVNAVPEFTQQPAVINGFSDLMVEVFGENGKHARSAVGMGSLPNNIAVEIELIVKLKDDA